MHSAEQDRKGLGWLSMVFLEGTAGARMVLWMWNCSCNIARAFVRHADLEIFFGMAGDMVEDVKIALKLILSPF